MTEVEKRMIEKLGLNVADFEPKKVDPLDVIEAQVLYTALMTDTLIEEEGDE